MMKKGYKKCHYCGEEIKEVAIKCRFCGERLEEKTTKKTITKKTLTKKDKKKTGASPKEEKIKTNKENNYKNKFWSIKKKERSKISRRFHLRNLRVSKSTYLIDTVRFILIRGISYGIITVINWLPLSILYCIIFIYFGLIDYVHATIGRMHDIRKSGWLLLIPFVNVILWFFLLIIKGDKNDNEYGENEKTIFIRCQKIHILGQLAKEALRIGQSKVPVAGNYTPEEVDMILKGVKLPSSEEDKNEALKDAYVMGMILKDCYTYRFEWDEELEDDLNSTYGKYYRKYLNNEIEKQDRTLEKAKEYDL